MCDGVWISVSTELLWGERGSWQIHWIEINQVNLSTDTDSVSWVLNFREILGGFVLYRAMSQGSLNDLVTQNSPQNSYFLLGNWVEIGSLVANRFIRRMVLPMGCVPYAINLKMMIIFSSIVF
jgi:hypothetical protein